MEKRKEEAKLKAVPSTVIQESVDGTMESVDEEKDFREEVEREHRSHKFTQRA